MHVVAGLSPHRARDIQHFYGFRGPFWSYISFPPLPNTIRDTAREGYVILCFHSIHFSLQLLGKIRGELELLFCVENFQNGQRGPCFVHRGGPLEGGKHGLAPPSVCAGMKAQTLCLREQVFSFV